MQDLPPFFLFFIINPVEKVHIVALAYCAGFIVQFDNKPILHRLKQKSRLDTFFVPLFLLDHYIQSVNLKYCLPIFFPSIRSHNTVI